MFQQLKRFFIEVFREYRARFLRFWLILYGAAVLGELSWEIFLENARSVQYLRFPAPVFLDALLNEFAARPVLVLPLLATFFFGLWGFSALYFSFSGLSVKEAVARGLQNVHRYLGFLVLSGALTALGFLILTAPALLVLSAFGFAPLFLNGAGLAEILPSMLVFSIPGIYLLVSLSSGPFILLLEKKSILEAIRESCRRVSRDWFWTGMLLLCSLVLAGIAQYGLSRIMFSLKLALVPDLSFRGETSLRIFFYSIPWVIVASFFDLAVYRVYLRLKSLSDSLYPEQKTIRKDF